jgi:hypothetical protein
MPFMSQDMEGIFLRKILLHERGERDSLRLRPEFK